MGIRQLELPPSMASLARGHEDEDDLDGEEWVNPPSPAERCDAAVARGDVLELFNTIRSSEPQLIKHKAEFAKLQSLLESKMQDDLEGSIETVLSQGCALTSYLLLRLRYLVLFQVDAAGFLDPKCATPVYDRVMHVQQHIERMEQHLLSVQQQQAATKRLQELARAKSLENERNAPIAEPEHEHSPNGKPPAAKPQNGTNGVKPRTNGTAPGKLHCKRF